MMQGTGGARRQGSGQGMVALLQELQGSARASVFARELGIAHSTLVKVYAGRRGAGRKVVAALLRRYPERRNDILSLFLPSD
jgi:hypothetical protein